MSEIKNINGSTIVFNKMPKIECEDITIKEGENLELFNYLVVYDEDNNIVSKEDIIISKNNVDTSKIGNYEILVEVNDKTNTYRVQKVINVLVKTNNKPVIIGADNIEIEVNKVFNPLYGVIATDTEDGVITDKIVVTGFLNVCSVGLYILTYSVTDSDNNMTTVERKIQVLEKEKEVFGFYLSSHPTTMYMKDNPYCIPLNTVDKYFSKKIDTLILVDKIKTINTKKGDKMAFITGSDETSTMEYTLFPKIYNEFSGLKKGDLLKIRGTVERRLDQLQIIVEKIKYLETGEENG